MMACLLNSANRDFQFILSCFNNTRQGLAWLVDLFPENEGTHLWL